MSVFTSSYSYFNISSKTVFVSVLCCIHDSEDTRLFQQLGNPPKIYAFNMNGAVSFGLCH